MNANQNNNPNAPLPPLSAAATERLLAVLGAAVCPISHHVMRNPTILAGSGLSYERTAIETHLRAFGTDPATGAQLNAEQRLLLPNPALQRMVEVILARLRGVFDDNQENDAEAEGPAIIE